MMDQVHWTNNATERNIRTKSSWRQIYMQVELAEDAIPDRQALQPALTKRCFLTHMALIINQPRNLCTIIQGGRSSRCKFISVAISRRWSMILRPFLDMIQVVGWSNLKISKNWFTSWQVDPTWIICRSESEAKESLVISEEPKCLHSARIIRHLAS